MPEIKLTIDGTEIVLSSAAPISITVGAAAKAVVTPVEPPADPERPRVRVQAASRPVGPAAYGDDVPSFQGNGLVNNVPRYAAERLERRADAMTRARDIRHDYLLWCRDRGEQPVTWTLMGYELNGLGYSG